MLSSTHVHPDLNKPYHRAYGFSYKSIIGNGVSSIVENMEEKKSALSLLMKHQTGKDFTFEDKHAKAVTVFKVEVTNFSAKEYK